MKKLKIAAILVIVVCIIALGLLMGKEFFKRLEERSSMPIRTGLKTGTATEAPPPDATPSPVVPAGTAVPKPETAAVAAPVGTPASPAPATAMAGTASPAAPGATPGTSPLTVSAPVEGVAATPVGQSSEMAWPPASGQKWFAYAAAKGVRVREGPEEASKLLMTINLGTKGVVVDRKNGWTKVKYDFKPKMPGWTRDDFLTMGPAEIMVAIMGPDGRPNGVSSESVQVAAKEAAKKAAQMANTVSVAVAKPAPPSETVKGFAGGDLPRDATILTDPARVRAEPSTKAAMVGKVNKGEIVTVRQVRKVGRYQWFEIIYGKTKKEGWTREDNLQF